MKTKVLLSAAVLFLLTYGQIFAQFEGSGNITDETRNFENFDRIEISGAFKTTMIMGDKGKILITADDNLLEKITTEVNAGTLEIRPENNTKFSKTPELKITAPSLEGISLSGSNDVTATGINSDLFTLNSSGSGRVKLEGKASKLEIGLSGSSQINAKRLVAEDVILRASGSTKAAVHADENLVVQASGSTDVSVYGDPENIEKDVSGGASVKRMNNEEEENFE